MHCTFVKQAHRSSPTSQRLPDDGHASTDGTQVQLKGAVSTRYGANIDHMSAKIFAVGLHSAAPWCIAISSLTAQREC